MVTCLNHVNKMSSLRHLLKKHNQTHPGVAIVQNNLVIPRNILRILTYMPKSQNRFMWTCKLVISTWSLTFDKWLFSSPAVSAEGTCPKMTQKGTVGDCCLCQSRRYMSQDDTEGDCRGLLFVSGQKVPLPGCLC